MADVFVSYKREDAARVRKLVAALRAGGIDCWWDEDIPASAPWEATIERALADAKAVIVCWSPDAVASENVRSEARVAREDGRLIQVFLRPCSPPLFFGERQGVDLSSWRGKADDPRIGKIAERARAVAAGERIDHGGKIRAERRFDARIAAVLALLVLLIGGAGGWWFLSPAKAAGPTTLAVLPFRALDPADANLVDAIWDDTRGALGRNPNLRVLGRSAVESLADQHLQPQQYRSKVGAAYLLDGRVQHVGDQVSIKVSLVDTKDGSEVWNDQVGGKLDDVFAFQNRIASEVEGRVRGRLAPGRGIKPENISTSGEVYQIFADARADVRKRDRDGLKQGIALLRKALAIDPNYAPAWAELGVATRLLGGPKPIDQVMAESASYLRRAITLAPNLAHARAALAMVQDYPPGSEGELRKAVALDPSDAEAWLWLGSFYANVQRDYGKSLAAMSRSVEIEPLLWPAVGNKITGLDQVHDESGLAREFQRIRATGDAVLLLKARAHLAEERTPVGDAVNLMLELRAKHPEEASWVDGRIESDLVALDFVEEGLKAAGAPLIYARDYRGDPEPAQSIRADLKRPIEFWIGGDEAAVFGRLLPPHGRLAEYVGYYKAAFKTPDDFAAAFAAHPGFFMSFAPNLAVNLRAAGESVQSAGILSADEELVASKLRMAPNDAGFLLNFAQLRAAQRRDAEALSALDKAVKGGWLPDRQFFATDIADEPCFAHLKGQPQFEAIRRQILGRIEFERRRVSPALLAASGLRTTLTS